MNSRSELISKHIYDTGTISQEVFNSIFEDRYRYFSLEAIIALCPTITRKLLYALGRDFNNLEPKARIEVLTELFNFVQNNYPELLI